VRATLTALARKDGAHEALSLVGRDGVQLVSSTAADEGTNISAQPSFQQALTGTANISDIALSPSTGRPVFFVSVPVSSGSGGAVGVLRLRLNPSVIFQRIVADAAGYGAGASTMLVDEHGVRLALSDPTQNQLAWDGGVLLTVMTEPSDDVRRRWAEEGRFGSANAMASVNPDAELWQAINAGGTSPTGLKRAGAQQHVASATLTVKPWRYVSITPDSSISAITDATLADLTRISVLTAAAAVLVALLFSLTMTRPLLRLARAVDEVSMGDTSVTMEARSNDEIGDLAAAFSRMVASLRFYARKSAGQQPGPDNPLNLFDHAA
jgi:HAMP domain-containing protein